MRITGEKFQAVILMHQENISIVRVAHLRDCSESTVSCLIKIFETEGTVDKKPRSGRLRLPSKHSDTTLIQLCGKNRFASSVTLAREWN